jgi:DNA-directed RNA polymerase subunit RPC12/RpoP
MMTTYTCSRCKATWGFPDLTEEQARAERRDICFRCGQPQRVVRLSTKAVRGVHQRIWQLLALLEAVAIPIAYWLGAYRLGG